MSTLFQSIVPDDPSRLAATGIPAQETYGGENLPVLVRLPELSDSTEPTTPAIEGSTPQDVSAPPAAPSSASPEASTGNPSQIAPPRDTDSSEKWAPQEPATAGHSRSGQQGQQRSHQQSRSQRKPRYNSQRLTVPHWLRGSGQLAFAAVLAGLILMVLVTVKNWNTSGDSSPRQVDKQSSLEASQLGADHLQARAAHGIPQPPAPSQTSPPITDRTEKTNSWFPTSPSGPDVKAGGVSPTSPSGPPNPTDSRTIGRHDTGVVPKSTTMTQYPTTGVEPALGFPKQYQPQNTAANDSNWDRTRPGNAVRSADRTAPSRSDSRRY